MQAEIRDKISCQSGIRTIPDDVKMLFRRKDGGLESNTTYSAGYNVKFATAAPAGTITLSLGDVLFSRYVYVTKSHF